MGVDYRHFLIVDQHDWHPAPDTFERVNEVLGLWGLNDKLLEIVDLAGGRPGRGKDASLPRGFAGKAFKFEGANGAAVARLAGPSLYDCDEDDRYLMQVLIVLGEDYRIQWSSEALFFDRIEPRSIEYSDEEPYETAYSESFPSTDTSPAPIVKLHIEEYARKHLASKDYKGYWRAAVILDFGKDLPAFTDQVHSLPSTEFVEALRQALRAHSIVEVGEFY